MPALLSMLFNLALTLLVECGLSLLFRSKPVSMAVLYGNLLTNPVLNYTLILVGTLAGRTAFFATMLLLETAAVGIEALLIGKMAEFKATEAIGLSFLLNLASFAVGTLLW